MEIDFNRLFDCFKIPVNTNFINLVDKIEISPGEFLYKTKTTRGPVYVFETDYVDNFKDIIEPINELLPIKKFYKVKKPKNFKDTNPFKIAKIYKEPLQWEQIKKFANDKYSSKPYYFNFLFR